MEFVEEGFERSKKKIEESTNKITDRIKELLEQ